MISVIVDIFVDQICGDFKFIKFHKSNDGKSFRGFIKVKVNFLIQFYQSLRSKRHCLYLMFLFAVESVLLRDANWCKKNNAHGKCGFRCRWSLSKTPENIRKAEVFLMFSGSIERSSGMKWVNTRVQRIYSHSFYLRQYVFVSWTSKVTLCHGEVV